MVLGTGNKFLSETDYTGSSLSTLRVVRTYNSAVTNRTKYDLATQWSIGIQRALSLDSTTNPTIAVAVRPDGKALRFTLTNGNWVPDADITDSLIELKNGATPTGWRYTTSDNATEEYDAAGLLLKIAARSGLVQRFSHSTGTGGVLYGTTPQTNGYLAPACTRPAGFSAPTGRNVLLCVTDTQGRQLNINTDTAGRITKFADPAGQITQYAYDANNNLSSVTYPDGKTKTYLYENTTFKNALTGITDENGVRYATYSYDTQGRATAENLAGGAAATSLIFGTNSTTVTDALGTARTYSFQPILGMRKSTGQTQPGGSGCGASASNLTYDANGNIASRTDFNGNVTKYSYDLARNLQTQRIETFGKPEQRTINTIWHASYRLPLQIAEPLKRTTFAYDTTGNVLTKTEQATTDTNGSQGLNATLTGPPRTWTWTYNNYGQMLTATDPRGNVTTTAYYDAADPDVGKRGNLASVTNALGQVTRVTAYDANGRALTLVDPNGITTTLTYDLRGRLTSKTVGNEITTYTYDSVGQLTQIGLPDGASLNYSYDPAHRLVGIGDGAGNQIRYTLDALGNRLKEDTLDPNGQLSQTRSRVYDALSRLYKEVGAQNQTTTYAYDANGNLTGIVDPLNRSTTQGFDALNRLIRITDPASGQTKFGYNGQDRLVQVTDPRNLVTAYTVDGLGNQTAQQSPDTGVTNQTFDAVGKVASRTDAKGQTATYQYDALNRLTQATLADGSRQIYTWDLGSYGIGRLAQISEQNAAGQETARSEYGYDAQGRIVRETRTLGGLPYVTAYAYSGGRLNAITYPSGRLVEYAHDAAGRVSQISTTPPGRASQIVVSQVAYQPFGNVKSFTYGNGQTYTRSVDQDGRIGSYTLAGQTQAIGYDTASRISFMVDVTNPAHSANYGYDSLDRLTSATLPSANYGYVYDADGNRTTQTVGASSIPVSVSATSNRIQSVGSSPPRIYAYDPNGSTTSDGNAQYAYDVRGRQTQATTASGATSYQVNAQGERVKKSTGGTNGSDRRYHYDRQGRLIAEGGAQGQIDREYIYLNDLPVAVVVE